MIRPAAPGALPEPGVGVFFGTRSEGSIGRERVARARGSSEGVVPLENPDGRNSQNLDGFGRAPRRDGPARARARAPGDRRAQPDRAIA